MVSTIKNSNLNTAEKSNVAVIDFSATWCGPCKMLAPVFHELAEEEKGVDFYSADVDQNMELAQKFNVSAVPTVVLLKNGKEVSRSMGFQPKESLRSWIEGNL